MRIYLIRHGETTGDVENRYGEDYDDHLTERGKQQARELANKTVGLGIQKIFCSPRIRTIETARILDKLLDAGVMIAGDMRERNNYGILTGMKKDEAAKKYPEQIEILKDYGKTPKGGEDYENFKKRVLNAFNAITNSDYDAIAIVTHAGPIRAIFREVLKKGELKNVGDCALIELEKKSDNFELLKMENASL